jgi:hypothetical protein
MINVPVLFGEPIDQVAFETHFTDVHYPMLTSLPGLKGCSFELRAVSLSPRPHLTPPSALSRLFKVAHSNGGRPESGHCRAPQ